MTEECDDLTPLNAHERKVYGRAGLAGHEAIRWRDRGIGPYNAEKFRAMGFSLEDAVEASEAGFGPTATKKLLESGVTLAELKDWSVAKGDPEIVLLARGRGLEPAGMSELLERFGQLERHGISREQCEAWLDASYDLAVAADLLDAGTGTELFDFEYRVATRVADPTTRDLWRLVRPWITDPSDAMDAGLTPVEALLGATVHDASFRPPRLVAYRTVPYLRCADDAALPVALRRFVRRRPPVAALRRLGFDVARHAGRRIVTGIPGALVLELAYSVTRHRGDFDRPGTVRVVSTPTGHRVDPGTGEPIVAEPTLAGSLERLGDLLGTLGGVVRVATCPGLPDAALLDLLVATDLPLGFRTTVNGRVVRSRSADGEQHIAPERPTDWHGHTQPAAHVHAIGAHLFVGRTHRDTVAVGPVDESARLRPEPVVWDNVAALAVMRYTTTRPDGDRTTVHRSSTSSFVVTTDDGTTEELVAHSLAEVLGARPALTEAARSAFTTFTTSVVESFETNELISLIRPVGEPDRRSGLHRLVRSLGDRLPGPALAIARLDLRSEGPRVDYLPVTVDGRCVAETAVDGLPGPLLFPAGDPETDQRVYPPRVWASFTGQAGHSSGSRPHVLQLVPVTQGHVATLRLGRRITHVTPCDPDDRVAAIARWILDIGRSVGIDLIMLAVETLHEKGAFVEWASQFDDDGPADHRCSIDLAITDDEIPEFFEHVRAAGRGDCIDAIERARSGPARRRKRRLAATR